MVISPLTIRCVCLVCLTDLLGVPAFAQVVRESTVQFNRDIRPILSDKCFACHGPDPTHREADLRLDTEDGASADLGGYQAIAPGKPEESELITRITSQDADLRMPPADSGKQLAAAEIETLTRWIAEGAKYQQHWSLVPPSRPVVPQVRAGDWPRNDVDRFVLARIEAAGLKPSPPADPVTLVRRLYFDLVGLPPTPQQAQTLVQDDRPEAYERLVDDLLASDHYGERMAIYWLDLVRYADSVGYHGDQEHAITPYRDYVIYAFNENMPFDRFTTEQLAGDLLPEATVDQKIASGYLRVLQTSHEGGVQVGEYLHKYDADRIRSLGGTWMGATLGCTECHDHKYDPYTQKEFYQLVAFFADVDDSKTFRGSNTSPTRRDPEMEVLSPLDRQQIERMEAEIERLRRQIAQPENDRHAAEANVGRALLPVSPSATGKSARPTDATTVDAESLSHRLKELQAAVEARRQELRRTMVTESVEPREIHLLPRGDWLDNSGPVVEPDVPACLPPLNVDGRRPTRMDLARWLTSPEHPQTARVFVNRLWYLFFGSGLARSLDDVGSQGQLPTHPELLDWLAVEFIESGWDVKHMVKLLAMSSTYRQASLVTDSLRQQDPENRLFARQSRWRLPAEMIRDNALAVSGLLVDRLGGESSRPYQPQGYYAHLNFPTRTYQADKDDSQYRRGVYVHWQRQFLHPMLRAFDAPSREECTAQRTISNTPSAALTLLNDPTFVEAARVLAARMVIEGGQTDEDRIRWAWQRVLTRTPQPKEIDVLRQLLEQNRTVYRADGAAAASLIHTGLAPVPEDIEAAELAAWTAVSRALLNLNETITRN